jgi:hypothetical protein
LTLPLFRGLSRKNDEKRISEITDEKLKRAENLEHRRKYFEYVLNNPVKAGLVPSWEL